ncbi:hypothetical protein D7W79_01695 [Corallococcus exercitus]|uniref:hypothetical protein n=1 Tax=Corallococcus exercitus TaxID=2316736 RepID=UPI000EA0E160|nr:hypothetical protein [Corallococcus exercitus]RKG82741.1 hypothetical protein D7W79_01695 [Corallococcus exercitus]
MNTLPLYAETQRFRARWLWALLLSAVLLPILLTGTFLYIQLSTGQPVGDRPLSDTALAATFAGALVLGLLLVTFIASAKLVIRVERTVLSVRFFPFTQQRYPLRDVVRWEVRDYRPMAEYGGWGIRWGRGGRAYTVSGHRGVQLELRGGRKVLLGSQRPDELAAALRKAHDLG